MDFDAWISIITFSLLNFILYINHTYTFLHVNLIFLNQDLQSLDEVSR